MSSGSLVVTYHRITVAMTQISAMRPHSQAALAGLMANGQCVLHQDVGDKTSQSTSRTRTKKNSSSARMQLKREVDALLKAKDYLKTRGEGAKY